MDRSILRVGSWGHQWFDVDFAQVIAERKRFYEENEEYHMLASDVREDEWLKKLPKDSKAIVVMEGVSMYFAPEELKELLRNLCAHFRLAGRMYRLYEYKKV